MEEHYFSNIYFLVSDKIIHIFIIIVHVLGRLEFHLIVLKECIFNNTDIKSLNINLLLIYYNIILYENY